MKFQLGPIDHKLLVEILIEINIVVVVRYGRPMFLLGIITL
jgi:hypothetical protein